MTAKIKKITVTVLAVIVISGALAHEPAGSDYPTSAKADYVFGCMHTNGQTMDALSRCSCSVDFIAKRMPFEEYTEIETIMRTMLDQGQRGSMFKELPWAKEKMDKFKKLQAKSNVECFN